MPVLILDEAHRSLGPERSEVIKKFNGLQLGFTATSEFSEERKVADLLEEEIFRMDVAEGIREGLICQTQTIHAYTNVDLSSVVIKGGKYSPQQLEKVINVQGRNIAAVELYEKKFNHLKVICNCSGVLHAQSVAKLFNERGIHAACITGTTPKEQRIQILKDFKSGIIKVLTNAKVLLEGFNEPSCSVTFNLHPTLSLVDAEQRARSGRLDKNNSNKWSYVVDFIDQHARQPQVLYSEILGADRVWDISEPENVTPVTEKEPADRSTSEPRPPINFDDLSMDGLRVVVDTRNIMEITNRNLISRKEEKKEWTFETLQVDVRAKGIKSSEDYNKNAPKNKWRGHSDLTAMPEFPKNPDGSNDWDMFLGREKFDFEKFRAEVIASGIKSSDDYSKNAPKNKWPTPHTLAGKPEFPKHPDGSNDWDTFLGKENKKIKKNEKWTFETLQADIRAMGIKSSKDYGKNSAKYNWPARITLSSMPEFPKNANGSNDWDTFFGNKKKEWTTFETLQQEVRAAGITSSKDFDEHAPQNKWPNKKTLTSMPEFPKNADGSRNWDTFLGRERKEKWTFETLQADVRAKGIISSRDYSKNSQINNWPVFSTIISKPEFPKNPDGSNDWDTFLGR